MVYNIIYAIAIILRLILYTLSKMCDIMNESLKF